MNSFSEISPALLPALLKALQAQGYERPTPIQAKSMPALLAGRDVLGVAQTGTGKTAAFALPTLQLLSREARRPAPKTVRALVLTPTRELAIQVHESFQVYGANLPLKAAVIFGGVGQNPQVQAVARGVDVLVATPGRLLDLMGQGFVNLSAVEIFILDEADRMLDMGFIHDVRRIEQTLPRKRQSLLFSATMPAEVVQLAQRIVSDPVRVDISPGEPAVDRIEQHLYFADRNAKVDLLRKLLEGTAVERAIVFTRTKHGANRLVQKLGEGIGGEAIHGNKSQSARQRALENFRSGRTRVLVATDVAARGIDIDGISHVFNFDLPNEPESYVHRIGRTARAGATGIAVSFCEPEERAYLRAIERLLDRQIPVKGTHKLDGESAKREADFDARGPRPMGGGRRGGGGGGGARRGGGGGGGFGGGRPSAPAPGRGSEVRADAGGARGRSGAPARSAAAPARGSWGPPRRSGGLRGRGA